MNKRNKSVVDLNSLSTVIVEEERGFNHPDFKENQVLTLTNIMICIFIINFSSIIHDERK